MTMCAGSRVRLSPDALSQDLGSELFILDMRRKRYFSLDAVGARMWALLGEHGDVNRIVGQILEEYEVDWDTAQADVSDLVARLAGEGLLFMEA
jgi:hypothetical protein